MTERSDVVTLEVVHNRLEAIVEQMGLAMLKTAHSVLHSECKDFSVALFAPNGDLLAMGQHIPHHQGGMENYVKAMLELWPGETTAPGNAFIVNDPYMGGTHPQDVLVFAPVHHDAELVGFAGCAAHHVDIGGMTTGGYAPTAVEHHQEGIVFPGVKLIDRGELREDVVRMFCRNVRLPDEQRGDLLAQVAAVHIGDRRVRELVERWGAARFGAICTQLVDLTEERVRAELRALPDGTYEIVDYLEHDGHTDRVYELRLRMTIAGSDVELDFTGTDAQAPGFINAALSNTKASAYAAFMLFLDPQIPRNHGFFRPIEVIAPAGCLLNATFPAPVAGSTTECGGRVYDLVLQALSQASPERAIGTWSVMWLAVVFHGIHPRTGKRFIHWILDGGAAGGGARPDSDGWDASAVCASTCLIPNVEVEEQAYPVRYLRRGLRPDGGGAGKHRGGLPIETEIMVEADCEVTAFGNRTEHPPRGVFGGRPGGLTLAYIRRGDGTEEQLPAKVVDVPMRAGDSFVMRACGGGGFGDPRERPRELIERDLAAGFVTEAGLADYGLSERDVVPS